MKYGFPLPSDISDKLILTFDSENQQCGEGLICTLFAKYGLKYVNCFLFHRKSDQYVFKLKMTTLIQFTTA